MSAISCDLNICYYRRCTCVEESVHGLIDSPGRELCIRSGLPLRQHYSRVADTYSMRPFPSNVQYSNLKRDDALVSAPLLGAAVCERLIATPQFQAFAP